MKSVIIMRMNMRIGVAARKTMWAVLVLLAVFALPRAAVAQRDQDEEPTATLNFLVVKEDNGKPIRSAAVIMHPVNTHGKQSRGGLELKTDADGKTSFDGVPYGALRVQVLASGFQTFGEDYDIEKAKMDFVIKLKRPQGQYSIYQDHPEEKKDDKTPPPDPNAKPQ
jgi:Carboxypeptidase regulatory-like domain